MVIKSEFLKEYSYERISREREKSYQEKMAYYKRKAQEDEENYIAKMEEFKSKNIILTTPVEELTEAQKIQLANVYCLQFEALYAINHSRKEVKKAFAKYKDIKTLTKKDFESMQSQLISMFKPAKSTYYSDLLNQKNDTVFFNISKQDVENYEFLETVEKYCNKLLEQGLQVRLLINAPMREKKNESQADYLYSTETINNLVQINNRLQAKGMKKQICFNEYSKVEYEDQFDNSWELNDVIKANRSIDNIVAKIKESKLSPFEAMVYIHKYITSNFQYTESTGHGSWEKSRVLPSIFVEGKIVCSGYASFVKAIIDKLNDPNLKCGFVGCELYNKNLTYSLMGAHCHNLINIKDEKYGINGVYVEDACWDSKREGFDQGRGFAHCLYPVGDLQHFQTAHYHQKNTIDRMSSVVVDPEKLEKDMEELSKVLKGEKSKSFMQEYAARKEAVKYGADIVKEFAHNSSPIDIENYQKAIEVVFQKMQLCEESNIDLVVDGTIFSSAIVSQSVFNKMATSQFTKIAVPSKLKQKSSLATNDGRSI